MKTLIIYSLMIFFAAFAGGILPLFSYFKKHTHLKIYISLGAGLLLGMSFFHMLPEAAEIIPHTFGFWALFGFVLLFVLERYIMIHACEEHGCHYHTIGVAAFVGLAVHGIIEGFALSTSALTTNLGPLVLIAILSHKAPAGVSLTSILQLAKKDQKQIILFVLGVAFSGPLGIWVAYALLERSQLPSLAGILLAMSSGTFFYISACDLLPELHHRDADRNKRFAAFFIGLFLSFLSGYLFNEHVH